MKESQLHIAIVLASLRTGGAERAMLNLANGFSEKNINADIVLVENTGEFISSVISGVNVYDLNKRHARNSIFTFRKYLRDFSPDVLIVTQTHVQLMVLVSIIFSRWKGIIILNEQSTFSLNSKNKLINLFSFLFRRANAIVAVSEGSARDFSERFPSLQKKITVIPNPVFSDNILKLKNENVNHPFLNDKQFPLILSAGRLTVSKNFTLLLDVFALILKKTNARLIILGDGNEKVSLKNHAERLGISPYVSFPGNVNNPYAFMSRCDVFVLSSQYEGLPTVLIEALACGCKIVSTDCPHGPAEILENGKYGLLVPLNDAQLFADEILKSISSENNKNEYLARARDFSLDLVTEKYLELIKKLSANE